MEVHRRPSSVSLCGLVWKTLAIGILMVGLGEGAHSRRRVVRVANRQERYDRSITQFDPNGRLLQVEYSMQAVARSSPILCALSLEDSILYVVVCQNERHQQLHVHRLDDHIFLFGTGVAGDTIFTADFLRLWCQRQHMSNGEPPTVREVAEEAASLQHQLTREGGCRPFGCTVMIAGVDPFVPAVETTEKESLESSLEPTNESTRNSASEPAKEKLPHALSKYLQLYRSGPGGIMEDCLYCVSGKNEVALMKRLHQEYPTILTEQKTGTDNGLTSKILVMRRLVRLMREQKSKKERGEGSFFNVWTIEPSFGRRGNLQAECHCGL